jgi:hypothetical protein
MGSTLPDLDDYLDKARNDLMKEAEEVKREMDHNTD